MDLRKGQNNFISFFSPYPLESKRVLLPGKSLADPIRKVHLALMHQIQDLVVDFGLGYLRCADNRVFQVFFGVRLTFGGDAIDPDLSLIHISEPTRLGMISYAVFCL